jgi:hypothetical protein
MPQDHRHGHDLKLHRSTGFGEVSSSGPQCKTPTRSALPQSGTAVAINILALGVAANFGKLSVSSRQKRGGARNRADRVSFALTIQQVANLKAAAEHAYKIGLPFNRMVTIHWESAGVGLEAMATATGRFTDLLSKAVTRHGSRTAWAWVHESGVGKGGHCHLLIYIPPKLANVISRRQRAWIKAITGRRYKSRVILSKPIGGRLGLETGNPDLHGANLSAALAYVTKGANPMAAECHGLARLEPGGRVIGKRCGTSENISRKARLEWRD